jgi:ABC-2 type transport system permease protein
VKLLPDALYLARKDVARLFRLRETLVWVFVMPVVFFYFIGTITGNIASPSDSKELLAVDMSASAGLLGDQLVTRLAAAGYQVERVPAQSGRYMRRLEIPDGFTDAVLAGKPSKVRFTRADGGLGDEYDRARISRAVHTLVADAGILRKAGIFRKESAALTPEAFATLARERSALGLDVTMAGKRKDPPGGFDQSVPGTMVMFTMLVLFTVGAVSLTMERETGILRRLASAPMSRGAVVLGKWGARMAVGTVQIAFAMIAGTVLFHVHWGPNLPSVALVLLALRGSGDGARDAIGQLRAHAGSGGRAWGDRKQRARGVGRLLVADRDHTAVGAEDGAVPADRLDDGRAAQADQLRRVAGRRDCARLCIDRGGAGGGVRGVTIVPI